MADHLVISPTLFFDVIYINSSIGVCILNLLIESKGRKLLSDENKNKRRRQILRILKMKLINRQTDRDDKIKWFIGFYLHNRNIMREEINKYFYLISNEY